MMMVKQYRITGISTHDITIVQHERGSGGLKRTFTDGSNVRRRWRFYDQAGINARALHLLFLTEVVQMMKFTLS